MIILIKDLKAKFKEELSYMYNFINNQNPIRFPRIDPILKKIKSILNELNEKINLQRNLEFEMETELSMKEKPNISKKSSLSREKQEENNSACYVKSPFDSRKRSYSLESKSDSAFEKSCESEKLNLKNLNYFSCGKNSFRETRTDKTLKRSLSAYKLNSNLETYFSVKGFKSKAFISKEFLEPIKINNFLKNLNLTDRIKGSNSKLNQISNYSNLNELINKEQVKKKDTQLLDCACLKIINDFLKENFIRKLSFEISLYLEEKCESRIKEAEKFVKGKLKRIILKREAQEKKLIEKVKKKKMQYKKNFAKYNDSDSSEESGEELDFYAFTANCNNKKNLNDQVNEKDFIAIQPVKRILKAEEEVEEEFINKQKASNEENQKKAYFKKFKKLLKEKFLTAKQEGVESEYVIKEKEYFSGKANDFNPQENKIQILKEENKYVIENNFIDDEANSYKNLNDLDEKEIHVSYQKFLGEIKFNLGKTKLESFEIDKYQFKNNSMKIGFENPIAQLNNRNFTLKKNNNFFHFNSCENLESLDLLESLKTRKNTAWSSKEILKLNLSTTIQSKKDIGKNSNLILNNSYVQNTEKIMEMPESSSNLESNSNNKNILVLEENKNLIADFNSKNYLILNEKPGIKDSSFEGKGINKSNNSDSFNYSKSKNLNVFADTDSDEDEREGLKIKKFLKEAKNKQTDKKENIPLNKLKENNNNNIYKKNEYPNVCFVSMKEKENENKELKNLLRKESIQFEPALIIENKNKFYSAKATGNPSKKINFLDFPNNNHNKGKNNADTKTKFIKSNIFNNNKTENESFDKENSVNLTLDLNNLKADLNIYSNYKANQGDNNLIDNIQEQTNIKSIIQALDSRILKSIKQEEKIENSNSLVKSTSVRKISENLKSNHSQIFNDTYIIHLINDDNKSDEDNDESQKQANKAAIELHEKPREIITSNKAEENNNHAVNDVTQKQSVKNYCKNKEIMLSKMPGYNDFLIKAQEMIEEAKNKKTLDKTEINETKHIKQINENFNSELQIKDSIDSLNYFPKKFNFENNNNNNFKNNLNSKDLNQLNTNNQTKQNFVSSGNSADINKTFGNNTNILNKNLAYNIDNKNIVSSLANENNNNNNDNSIINNNNLANLENINKANLSQNNLNQSNIPSISNDANNQQIFQLLQTVLQNQNNNNMNNYSIMNNLNTSNVNGCNAINGNGYLNTFSLNQNHYDNFNQNLLGGNSMNPFYNNNNNNLIYMMLQQIPNSPFKDILVQILNSRNYSCNQQSNPMSFANNIQIMQIFNMLLLNGNKNFNNFPPPNNGFNQFNMLNNNMFNNTNNNNINNNQNQNNFMNKLIETLNNNQKKDSSTANTPMNNGNLYNISNNNLPGVNNQNQFNMLNNKEMNFPSKNQNPNNIQPQLRNILNDRNHINYISNNYQNLAGNLNMNCMQQQKSQINQTTNQSNLIENKDSKPIIKNKDDSGKSFYNAFDSIKEKEVCKYSQMKLNEEPRKINKLKISSMLSEKKLSQYDYSYSKSSEFSDKQ